MVIFSLYFACLYYNVARTYKVLQFDNMRAILTAKEYDPITIVLKTVEFEHFFVKILDFGLRIY